MIDRLTSAQLRTLESIESYPKGQTVLMTDFWRDRHHQSLLKRGLLRLGADALKTKASFLRGSITARGRAAVKNVSAAVRAQANRDYERDSARYAAENGEP